LLTVAPPVLSLLLLLSELLATSMLTLGAMGSGCRVLMLSVSFAVECLLMFSGAIGLVKIVDECRELFPASLGRSRKGAVDRVV